MKIISKEEMANMPKGIVFGKYCSDGLSKDWKIKQDEFCVISVNANKDGKVESQNWNISDCDDGTQFAILEEQDIRDWVWRICCAIGSCPWEADDEQLICLKHLLNSLKFAGED